MKRSILSRWRPFLERLIAAALSIVSFLAGCGATSIPSSKGQARQPSPKLLVAERLRTIDLGDGLSQHEAQLVAEAYFLYFVNDCGRAGVVARRDSMWISTPYEGYGEAPSDRLIQIDVTSGATSRVGSPAFEDLNALLTAIEHTPGYRLDKRWAAGLPPN